MPPRKNIEAGECSNPSCAAAFATVETKLEILAVEMKELKLYIKDEFSKSIQKQFDDQAKRIAALEKFRDEIIKKIGYAMGAFAVIFFLLQILVQVLIKKLS